MPTIERGVPLVQHVISRLRARHAKTPDAPRLVGGTTSALDALESKLMVELPPTLREFLLFDYTFASLGPKWKGTARFGAHATAPKPKLTSVRKLAEARTELGWTDSRIRTKLVRLPSLPRHPWAALYLGEARKDGELLILGCEHEDTLVRFWPYYTAFDLFLADQTGVVELNEAQRLDDLESHFALNPELGNPDDLDDSDNDY